MPALLAEGEELMHEVARLASGYNDLIKVPADFMIFRKALEGKFAETEHGREAIIELVCDSAGQCSDGFHFLQMLGLS